MPTTVKEPRKKYNFIKRNNDNSAKEFDTAAIARLKAISAVGRSKSLEELSTQLHGLSADEVRERLAIYGLNEVVHEKAPKWYIQLFQAFVNPFIAVLFILAIISLITDVIIQAPGDRDYTTVSVISTMVLLSVLLRFIQEFRSNKAAEKLKSMVKTTATVIRDEEKSEIDIKKLVPGDIIQLSAGDMIPADVRIMQSKDLFVSQSMLTGEALPVEKTQNAVSGNGQSPLELTNICFMGTNVVSGAAMAVVINTGADTYFGSYSKSLVGKRAETSFDKGVNSVSWLLIRFMLVMVPLVFLINGLTKHDWLQAFLFGISIAVGLTPEMLPMIVTANLAKGAVNMSKRKVVVKRLNAIQNIGAMDILCTDKTGTLTMDKIVLERHLNVYGIEDNEVMKWAYLNSYHQTGLKNLLDIAVLEHVDVHSCLKEGETYRKIDEIPFDFQRRRMSVILEGHNQHKHLLICKGAVEEVLDLCTYAFDPGEDNSLQIDKDDIIPIDENMRETVLKKSRQLNEEGLRVLLVAVKEYDERPLTYGKDDESEMILTGFIGFLDPAKPSAKPSIEALQQLGVSIKVLTGDNEVVTKKICKDVGIPVSNILMGRDLEVMTDEELTKRIDDVSILAKLSPIQKSRVVKVLQAKGHTVGFMGDGINDAAALRDSDVGISVDTAVDIAKESADIILLEKDLMVLRKGVIYGRRTFGNIIKYIKMTASSNFGNMFSMLGASALLPFLPMLPIQILINNLLYDISQISIPWDKMDEDYIVTPRKWDASGIGKFMMYVGPTSSIFDYATFAVLWFVFKANSPAHQQFFQTGWFIESLLSQTLIVHMIRTRKVPFIQSWATAPVVALTTAIMAVAIFLPFSPLAHAFKLTPMPFMFFICLIIILFAYCLLTQFVKNWFIRKFDQWL